MSALWDSTDCSLLGSSVHGIFQTRMLEWVGISFRGSSRPEIKPVSFALAGRFFFYLFVFLVTHFIFCFINLFFNINLFILIGGELHYNIVLVLPYINMNLPRVYKCSPSWTPLPTFLPIPSLWVIPVHQPWASCIMHRTWTGDSFQIWYYTCFNAILPNHPTLALSYRVEKTVLYICVSFGVSHTGSSLPSF